MTNYNKTPQTDTNENVVEPSALKKLGMRRPPPGSSASHGSRNIPFSHFKPTPGSYKGSWLYLLIGKAHSMPRSLVNPQQGSEIQSSFLPWCNESLPTSTFPTSQKHSCSSGDQSNAQASLHSPPPIFPHNNIFIAQIPKLGEFSSVILLFCNAVILLYWTFRWALFGILLF